MKIAIAGGTGFIGKALVEEFLKNNHKVIILTRRLPAINKNDRIKYVQWLSENSNPISELQNTDIFINLAGESINSGRWTEKRKNKILISRLEAVKELLEIMKKLERKPKAFINASAVGIYGTSLDKVFTEEEQILGNDFLAETVKQWEYEAGFAAKLGIRIAFCRFGIILDRNGGALPKISFPYKAFIGGNIGHGRQWMSWIHIEDIVKGITFIIENKNIQGPVNFTAPNPVTMSEFGKTLALELHRPHWLPVPSFVLRLLLGEMSTLVVDGQNVLPNKLLDSGFKYKYTDLQKALQNIFT
ncbi:TIGR01777 family oxidoreductase [Paenibacillus sp. BSR1-1]|uniref:TIGR01777 family oxidoreductase n=1 Tax=Paenibacillus sp. BSR1-1 TaxID=3020845 RepID=UPI0025B1D2DC|nr:TIGR01777 family oxidoreductase [Paenibacillus sp. BSR1-1]MDN3017679.1 TIGR01777 family oxidoreductase [Paenibacillus sp. BSR1-1]